MTATAALEAARHYLRLGWAPIPVPARQKGPTLPGWQTLRLTEPDLSAHFNGGAQNVGLLTGAPSGGLVDVDLDDDLAVVLAEAFLPATPLRSGRERRPRSHAWYICEPLPDTCALKAPDGATLVEVRGDGRQTLVSPSVHPEGDRYRWAGEPPAARVPGEALAAAGRRLAAATLLAKTWPAAGSRHDAALALAGLLVRGGWGADEAADFVRTVAEAAGDEDARGRGADVRSTARRLAAGGTTTGGPALAQLLGEPVVARVREWLGLSSFSSFMSSPRAEPIPWPDPLDEAAAYGLAGDFVRLVEAHTEADPVGLLAQFHVMVGNLIGRGPHFVAEADAHYANLFACLVGETAKGRKGSSLGQVRRPLHTVDPVWTDTRQQSGLSTGEGLLHAVRDPVRTPKGDLVDEGVSDKRLLVVEPELASVLRIMMREGSILSPLLRMAWDSGDLRIMTKHSPARATGAHVSLIGHITREELQRYLDRTESGNGFGNRFLWVCVRRARILPDGGHLETVDFGPWLQQLSAAVRFARQLGGRTLQRDEDARALWREVYPALSEGKPGLLGAVTSRAEAQTMRLALLYAVLDRCETIRRPHLEAALALWRYAEQSARYIFGDSQGDPVADDLLSALRARPEGLTRTDIRDLFARNRRADEIARALAALEARGLVQRGRETTAGRPSERWVATGHRS